MAGGHGRVHPTEASRSAVDSLVRDEFGLPDRMDPALEGVFSDVVDRLHEGDIDGAREAVLDAFESPCERDHPDLVTAGDAHRIACLRYADGYADPSPDLTGGDRD